jgi:ribosomal protein S18 acetylase RimI-like enzyme
VTGPSTEIRVAGPGDAPQAISTIVAAFITDPFARFVWPSAHAYLRSCPDFVREFAGGSFEHDSAYVSADFCGAALWLPPDVHPNGDALEKIVRDTTPPGHLNDALVVLEQMDQSHPHEPHWYLPVIGVEPNARGRGVGGMLMGRAVARCDEEGLPAYLESTNPQNISLYERHGFEIIREIRVGAFPVVTPMLRRPDPRTG